MQVQLKQLKVSPGGQLLMTDVSWPLYEQLLAEYAEEPGVRINYSQGVLEVMVPLPEHETSKVMIGDLVKVLMEEQDLDFWSLGSTTFKNEAMHQGVEADDCFYIEHEAAIRGKKRINLTVDPPPDLAIEIDITARSRFNNYEVLGVKELWRFDGTRLEINVLEGEQYVQVSESPHFPGLPLGEVIPRYLEQSKVEGRNKAIKAFRAWVRGRIEGS